MLSVIVPVLNEEKILRESEDYYQKLSKDVELIFVDGGSLDQTVRIAGRYGKVITSRCGRGIQMNEGAKASRYEILLFLHVDAFLNLADLSKLNASIGPDRTAVCFSLKIEDKKIIFRIFEWLVNFRAEYFGVLDGDLGLLIRKELFLQADQFDHVSLLEDLIFSKKIKRFGRVVQLPFKISVSPRRWYRQGFLNTFLLYTNAYLRLWLRN